MSTVSIESIANALLGARETGQTANVADIGESLADADQAYAVQDRVAKALHWFDDGVPLYWKSGGPSRDAAQAKAASSPWRP